MKVHNHILRMWSECWQTLHLRRCCSITRLSLTSSKLRPLKLLTPRIWSVWQHSEFCLQIMKHDFVNNLTTSLGCGFILHFDFYYKLTTKKASHFFW